MLLPVRRFGSNLVHLADVPESLPKQSIIMGSSCRTIHSPVATVCGAVLPASDNGRAGSTIIVMINWGEAKHAKSQCRRCKRLRPDYLLVPQV